MLDLGIVKPGRTINIPFNTFDSNDPSASVTATGLAIGDIGVYKDGGLTQRGSTAGFAVDTDFDALTGIHTIQIDLSDNTTAGFYEAGSEYIVTVGDITVDAATVRFALARFVIGYPDAILNTTIATLASQTSFTLEEGPADNNALHGFSVIVHDLASDVQICHAVVSNYVGATRTVTLAADPGVFTMAAGDNVSFFVPALQPTTQGRTLDVAATGEAGIDLDNTNGALGTADFDTGFLTAALIATGAIDAAALATDAANEIRDAVWAATTRVLTAGTNLNDLSEAQVNAQVDAAIETYGLDHLVSAAAIGTDVADNSIMARLAASGATADWDTYDNTTDSLQAIRDRGDANWTTGGGGALTQLLNVTPMIPPAIDLANTADYRLGLSLVNAVDDLPSTAEITPGTISIWRKAVGGTSWTIVVNAAACSESAGQIYYDEVFDAATGYAEGDMLRIRFFSQSITADANTHEISDATGITFYTGILVSTPDVNVTQISGDSAAADNLEADYDGTGYNKANSTIGTTTANTDMRGTDSAALASVCTEARLAELDAGNLPADIAGLNDPTAAAIADAVWDELQSAHTTVGTFGELATEIASILQDTNELQTDDVPGLIAALNDPTAAAIADAVWDELQSAHTGAGTFGEIATEIGNILTDTNELQTDDVPGLIAALNNISSANVLTQVNAALDTAISELGVGTPTSTPTIRTALMLLYMACRNQRDTTASADEIHNAAGTVICSATVSDDAVTFRKTAYT